MRSTRLVRMFLFLVSSCSLQGMDNPVPAATGPHMPARPTTPIIDLLSVFNFTLIDEQTLKPCTSTQNTQEAILEDSLSLRKNDS